MSLEFIRYADGRCALLDNDNQEWSSDNDPEFLEEFDALIESEEISAVIEYLEDAGYIPESEGVDIVDEDDGAIMIEDDDDDDDYDPDYWEQDEPE